MAQNAPALAILRLGFAYPCVAPTFRYHTFRTFYYHHCRALADLLRLEAQVKAAQGDWAGAVNSDLDALRLGEDMARGLATWGKDECKACQNAARAEVWEYIAHLSGLLARQAARRLEDILAQHVTFAEALRENQREYEEVLTRLIRHNELQEDFIELGIKEYQGVEGKSIWKSEWWNALPHSLPGMLYGKRLSPTWCNRYMERIIADAQRPYSTPSTPGISHPFDALNLAIMPQCTCLHENHNPYEDSFRFGKEEGVVVQNRLLLVTLARRAYHEEHGRYPSHLDLLTPMYLKQVPDDPFALNRLLRYIRKEQQYTLYSIGPDSCDNGGKPIANRLTEFEHGDEQKRREVQPGSEGDIVAGINRWCR